METNRLRQFCVIVETGSLVKASELLHLTHSALSKSMKHLQDEIGFPILRAAGRGIVPTEKGLEIYQRAKEFLEHENRLFKLDRDSISKTIKIASVEIFILTISEGFNHHSFEHNNITLLDLDPIVMSELIAKRELDYAITYAPFPMANIDIVEIGSYQLGCYVLNDKFDRKKTSEIPFAIPSQGTLSINPLGIKERDGWLDSVYPRQKKYAVNLLATAIELTLQGLCAVYIPDFVAKKINLTRNLKDQLVELPLPKQQKITHSAFILKHKDQTEDAIYKQLHRMIKDVVC